MFFLPLHDCVENKYRLKGVMLDYGLTLSLHHSKGVFECKGLRRPIIASFVVLIMYWHFNPFFFCRKRRDWAADNERLSDDSPEMANQSCQWYNMRTYFWRWNVLYIKLSSLYTLVTYSSKHDQSVMNTCTVLIFCTDIDIYRWPSLNEWMWIYHRWYRNTINLVFIL